jgi:hypothetical protein
MRTDLRELAKLAAPESSPTPHAFETADSSGYVDLSAFSATDDSWVERELARAGGRTRAGATLAAGSMAPVAMSSLLEAEPTETAEPSRKRGWIYTGLGLAGTAVVAILAVAIARHAPPSAKNAAHDEPAPPTVAAQVAVATAVPATPPPAPGPVAGAATAPIDVTVSAPENAPATKKHPASRAHSVAAAPPAPVAAAARPAQAAAPAKVVVPPSRGGGGGDSLMDLMRASINAPKKLH